MCYGLGFLISKSYVIEMCVRLVSAKVFWIKNLKSVNLQQIWPLNGVNSWSIFIIFLCLIHNELINLCTSLKSSQLPRKLSIIEAAVSLFAFA